MSLVDQCIEGVNQDQAESSVWCGLRKDAHGISLFAISCYFQKNSQTYAMYIYTEEVPCQMVGSPYFV